LEITRGYKSHIHTHTLALYKQVGRATGELNSAMGTLKLDMKPPIAPYFELFKVRKNNGQARSSTQTVLMGLRKRGMRPLVAPHFLVTQGHTLRLLKLIKEEHSWAGEASV